MALYVFRKSSGYLARLVLFGAPPCIHLNTHTHLVYPLPVSPPSESQSLPPKRSFHPSGPFAMSDAAASAGSNLWLQGHGPVVAAALHEWQLRPETASSSSVHSFCSVSMVDAMELDTATKAPTHSRELLHAWGEAWREAGTAGSSQRLQQPQAASDSHHLPCNSSNGCEQAKAKAKARETSREPGNAEGSALQPRSPRFQEPEERLADRPAEATLPRPRAARASRKKPKSSDGLSGAASSFSAALQRREPGETSPLGHLMLTSGTCKVFLFTPLLYLLEEAGFSLASTFGGVHGGDAVCVASCQVAAGMLHPFQGRFRDEGRSLGPGQLCEFSSGTLLLLWQC